VRGFGVVRVERSVLAGRTHQRTPQQQTR
jgi:hypothetical protein